MQPLLRQLVSFPVMGKSGQKFFYAVHRGRKPGVYNSWPECELQVRGYHRPSFRKFPTEEEAQHFARTGSVALPGTSADLPQASSSSSKAVASQPVSDALSIMQVKRSSESSEPLFKKFKPSYSKNFGNVSKYSTVSDSEQMSGLSEMAHVYTDGACTNNGQKGARAGIGVYWGPNHNLNVSERLGGRQTNNRAEIHAAVRALQQAKAQNIKHLTLYTDSNFVVNAMTKWVNGWKKSGWKLAGGGDVKNKEDFLELLEAAKGIQVHWVSHSLWSRSSTSLEMTAVWNSLRRSTCEGTKASEETKRPIDWPLQDWSFRCQRRLKQLFNLLNTL